MTEIKTPARVEKAIRQQAKAAAALRENEREVALRQIELQDVERRLAMLQAAAAPVVASAWCVDLTEDGTGAVATIEVPGEPAQVLIAPGCRVPAAADGRVEARATQDPNQVFFNAAVLPGVQKWRPDYRVGVIEAIDYDADTAAVRLEAAVSSADSLPVNRLTMLSGVPVKYMTCDARAFELGDRVVVAFEQRDWTKPQVIGFASNPRACAPPWLMEFLIPNAPYLNTGRGWGRPFDDAGVGTLEVLEPDGLSAHRERNYTALALTVRGQWHAYPWINQEFSLGGAEPRYGNWQQRVVLNGRKRLLQFNGTDSVDSGSKMLYEDRLGFYEGGMLIGAAPEPGPHSNPNVRNETHLVGLGGYQDDFGVEWMVCITWTIRTLNGNPVDAVLSVYAASPDASWVKILEDVHGYWVSRWAFYAYLQWKFNIDGTEASTIVQLPGYYSDDPQQAVLWPSWWPLPGRHGAVRRLQIASGAHAGAPPAASFGWNSSFNDFPVRVGDWAVYEAGQRFGFNYLTYYPRFYRLGDLSLGIDYDARTNQLATAWRHLSITEVFQFGSQRDVYWSDMRFGISIYSNDAGSSDVLYFKRYEAEPVRWDLPDYCYGALGMFDGSQGVIAFYVGVGTLVYRFNGDGRQFEPVWQAAPAHYQSSMVLPYRLGTLQDTWR